MMEKKLRAALFDLDGTLVNTLQSLRESMNQIMRQFSCDPISDAQTMQYVGNGYHVFVEKSLRATAERLYKEAENCEKKDPDRAVELDQAADEILGHYDEACEAYLRVFAENCTYRAEAYPGMKETLATLRERGLKLACITNKSLHEAEKVLDHVFGAGYFDYVSADDGTHPLKPDIGVVHDACAHLSVDASECIYVGDTRTDMETAERAGIPSIGCCYGFRGREELQKYHPAALVEHAGEIVPAMDRIVQDIARE